MNVNYGWRGTIGVMTPGLAPQVEFQRWAPKGVAFYFTLLSLPRADAEGLVKMGAGVEDAARLLGQKRPDLILFVCTTGSLIKGVGYDQEIIKRIASVTGGIPATTTATAVMDALRALQAKRVSIVTPYIEELNQAEKSFMERSGVEVTSIKGLGLDAGEIENVRPDHLYRLARENATEDADVVFLSCTGLCAFDIIGALEADLRKPVITSNQVSMWAALRKLGIADSVQGLGRLFTL